MKPSEEMNTGIFQKTFVHILIITAVGLLVYSNTFNVPFTFDDIGNIVKNPVIKNFQYFIDTSSSESYKTRFIGYLTFAMNYKLHGLGVTGYHMFNLIVHIFNALLVYAFLTLTFKTPYFSGRSRKDVFTAHHSHNLIALFTALLFVSHPVQTQAVTYIVQRLTSLATMFYLLSIVMYIKARLGQTIKAEVETKVKSFSVSTLTFYLLSILSSVFAMKTKEISFTLPVVIVLYEFMFLKGTIKIRALYLILLLLTMLIIPLTLIGINKPLGDIIGDVSEVTRLETNISRLDYLFTQFRVIVTYIRLLFFPVNQNLDYDFPIFHSFSDPSVFLSFMFLMIIFVFSIYLFYRSDSENRYEFRLISFGILWFFITLSVESSIIPIADVIFEHRIYLPSIGFFIAFVTFIIWIRNRLNTVVPVAGRAIIPMLVLVVLIFSAAAYARNSVWQNSTRFWEDVVKKSPLKFRSHNNLGMTYEKQGRFEEALREFKTALNLKPDSAIVHNNLGITYEKQGRFEEAIREFKAALNLKPDDITAHSSLGEIYGRQGRFEDAMRELRIALNLKPDYAIVHTNLGVTYGRQGRFEEAIRELRIALNLDPDDVTAHINLGVTYARQGRLKEAMMELRTALNLDPTRAEARKYLEIIKSQSHF